MATENPHNQEHDHYHEHQHNQPHIDNEIFRVRWATRQIAVDLRNRDLYVKCSMQEMLLYAIFFTFLMISCSKVYSYDVFAVSQEISSLFLDTNFDDTRTEISTITHSNVYTMEHLWKYYEDVLCDKLYGIKEDSNANTEESDVINYMYKLLYRPRSRQLRVEEGHCTVRNNFKGFFEECYVSYKMKYEDKRTFGPGNGTHWIYSDENFPQGTYYSGKLASYGAGGFYFDFPQGKKECFSLVKELKENKWFNRGTRAVFVDLAVFNGNANIICVVKLVFEFPKSGGIIPSYNIRTAKIRDYIVVDSKLDMICPAAVTIIILYYAIEELFEAVYFKLRYFTIFWNIIDFSIVTLVLACATMIMLIEITEPQSIIEDSAISGQGHKFFESLVNRHETLNLLMALLVFVACIKIIKYFDLTKSMTIIYLSIDRCCSAVARYLMVIMVVVFSFAVLGYCSFGTQVEGFSTVGHSLMSAMRILVRDFDYHSIEHVDQTMTTIFFNLYTCVVVFVFLTMLVAVAFHAYFDVNIEELIADRKQYVWDKVSTCLSDIFNYLGLNKWANKKPLEKVQGKPGYINYEDVYRLLRRCNFTNDETENILEQHNIVPHESIHENDVKNIFKDLMEKPQSPDEASETDPDSLDIDRITEQMNSLDKKLDRAHEDITVVISRLYILRGVLPTNYAEDKENRQPDN